MVGTRGHPPACGSARGRGLRARSRARSAVVSGRRSPRCASSRSRCSCSSCCVPSCRCGPPPGGSGVVAVLVDTSRSMGLAEAGGTRLARRAGGGARPARARALGQLHRRSAERRRSRAARRRGSADAPTRAVPICPGAVAAARDRYRDRDLAGIVLISDGGNLAPVAHAAPGPGDATPVITVGVGDPQIRYDREVRSVTAGPSAMDASLVDITATVVGHGATGRSQVRLLQGNRVLEVRDTTLPADGAPVQLVFPVQPERDAPSRLPRRCRRRRPRADGREQQGGRPGARRRGGRAASCSSRGRPASSTRSSAARGSSIRRSRSTPSSGRAATIRARTRYYVQAASARTAALSAGFPASREALYAYDAVVLANANLDALPRDALEQLADFVGERGGGLLVLGARALSPQGLAQSDARTRAAGRADRSARRPRPGGAARGRPLQGHGHRGRPSSSGHAAGRRRRRDAPPLAGAAGARRGSAARRRSGPAHRCSRPRRAAREAPCRSSPCSGSAAAAR